MAVIQALGAFVDVCTVVHTVAAIACTACAGETTLYIVADAQSRMAIVHPPAAFIHVTANNAIASVALYSAFTREAARCVSACGLWVTWVYGCCAFISISTVDAITDPATWAAARETAFNVDA